MTLECITDFKKYWSFLNSETNSNEFQNLLVKLKEAQKKEELNYKIKQASMIQSPFMRSQIKTGKANAA